MKEGWWINYVTGAVFLIDEHEQWIRRPGNADALGIPAAAQQEFPRFTVVNDRDEFLRYLFAHAPVMRVRGYGVSVTFQFASADWAAPLAAVAAWAAVNAGPQLQFDLDNFATGESRHLTMAELPAPPA